VTLDCKVRLQCIHVKFIQNNYVWQCNISVYRHCKANHVLKLQCVSCYIQVLLVWFKWDEGLASQPRNLYFCTWIFQHILYFPVFQSSLICLSQAVTVFSAYFNFLKLDFVHSVFWYILCDFHKTAVFPLSNINLVSLG